MNDAPKVDVKQKKPYTKPKVEQVQLRPDEAVLGMCRTTGKWGAFGNNCTNGVAVCAIAGS